MIPNDEDERLAQLPLADQEAVVAMYRRLADSPLATNACRVHAKAKAAALSNLPGLRARSGARKKDGKS